MSAVNHLLDLRIFLAVAETGSLTQAAKRMHTSLSAASTRMQKLEDILGCRLFDRSAKGIALTHAGEVLREHAAEVLAGMDKLQTAMAVFSREDARHLRVAGNYNASIGTIPDVIARFLAKRPNAVVEHVQMASEDVVAAVAMGGADIGICAYDQSFQGVAFEPFCEYRLYVIVPEGHPLAGRDEVDFEETLDYPFVALRDSAMQNFIFERIRDCGRTIEPRVRTTSVETLCDYVERGVGLAVLTGLAFERLRGRDSVRAVAIRNEWAQREMRIVLPASSQRLTRLQEEFLALLREAKKTCVASL